MSIIDVDKVQKYYDNNTSIFLKVGRSKERQNIHRQIWKPGIETAEEATRYLNTYIQKELLDITDSCTRICDLGCGVGATVFYLGKLFPTKLFKGISLSPEQIKYAKKFQLEQDKNNNCDFEVGDFHDLPEIGKQDMIYAIESFIHSDKPHLVFEQVSKYLKKGGTFILMDDTLGSSFDNSSKSIKVLDVFKKGWHAGNLSSIKEIEQMAQQYGLKLTKKLDYTKYIKLWRPRDYFIHFILLFYKLWPTKSVYFESLRGGDALQTGLKKRWIEFWILHFEKE